MKSVTLEFCHGSNAGTAIYLNQNEPDGSGSGHRIAGGKCWGFIRAEKAFKMDQEDLKELIVEARRAIKFLKQKGKRNG